MNRLDEHHSRLSSKLREVGVLLVESKDGKFVVLAQDIKSFHTVRDASLRALKNQFDLHAQLGFGANRELPSACLTVRSGRQNVIFRVNAGLRLTNVDTTKFYRLPELLRESGCAPWVKGIVLMHFPEDTDSYQAVVWVDLLKMASSLLSLHAHT